MEAKQLQETIEIPQGLEASIKDKFLTVKGSQGELTREIQARGLEVDVQADKIVMRATRARRTEKKLMYTYRAHIRNMLKGVHEGFVYKLKICTGHFPMNVTLKGDQFEIKNFIGEKVPRKLVIKKGADVKIEGDIITVKSINKEIAGQVAADIEKLTKRPGFDKRIFQDGIYITDKDGKHM